MISEAYIKKSFSSFTGGYEYINPDGLQIGLVLWKELHVGDYNATVKGLTYIHILLICADVEYAGLGKGILDDIYSYATMVNAAYIELIPLNDRLSLYYEENGYVKGDTPKFMKKMVEPSFRLASSNMRKSISRTRFGNVSSNRKRTLRRMHSGIATEKLTTLPIGTHATNDS